MARTAEVVRETRETKIAVRVNLDGTGVTRIQTGIGFLDHMLDSLGRHGALDLDEARQTAHAKLRGLFGTHFHPGEGRELLHQFPNPALLPGAEPPRDVRPAPHLGADTREVLKAFGFEPQEIDDLAATRAIGLGETGS